MREGLFKTVCAASVVLGLTAALPQGAAARVLDTTLNVKVWFFDADGTFSGKAAADHGNPVTATPVDASFTYKGPLDWYNGNPDGSNNAVKLFLNVSDISGFSSPSSHYTLNSFENAQMSTIGDDCTACTTFWQVTGTASFGSSGTVVHDDGASMYFDGNFKSPVEYAPTPAYIDTTSYTDTPGTHAFEIDYVEANGAASELLVTTVPEPSTWAMLLIGFAGLGAAAYSSRRKSVMAAA